MPGPAARILSLDFFNRDAETVARDLIGCHLARRRENAVFESRITETEAYVGPHDLACHAARGRTRRTETMFGPPGTLYIYLAYGLHWMLNVVTGPVGYPAAVLIRSTEAKTGPGRLTRALGITGELNGLAAGEQSEVWFVRGARPSPRQILRTPRIGIDYAGPVWSLKEYRFVWKGGGA
jgi:DNA-3-methyladenine glycosylase